MAFHKPQLALAGNRHCQDQQGKPWQMVPVCDFKCREYRTETGGRKVRSFNLTYHTYSIKFRGPVMSVSASVKNAFIYMLQATVISLIAYGLWYLLHGEPDIPLLHWLLICDGIYAVFALPYLLYSSCKK